MALPMPHKILFNTKVTKENFNAINAVPMKVNMAANKSILLGDLRSNNNPAGISAIDILYNIMDDKLPNDVALNESSFIISLLIALPKNNCTNV